MAKRMNHRGKYSHFKLRNKDRSKFWKYGKSSGKADGKSNKDEEVNDKEWPPYKEE